MLHWLSTAAQREELLSLLANNHDARCGRATKTKEALWQKKK